MKALLLIFAQLLAAICAAAVVSGLFPGPLSVNTTLSSETSVTRGLFIEMFLTFMLVLTILMLAAEKHRATFIAPIGIGLALFICELAGTYTFSPTQIVLVLTKQVFTSLEVLSTQRDPSDLLLSLAFGPATTGSTGSDLCSARSSPSSSTV
jgi:hypothetical protein